MTAAERREVRRRIEEAPYASTCAAVFRRSGDGAWDVREYGAPPGWTGTAYRLPDDARVARASDWRAAEVRS